MPRLNQSSMPSTSHKQGRVVRGTLLAIVALGVLLGSGCGSSDPLAGTWKSVAGSEHELVIAKTDAGYKVAFAGVEGLEGWTPLKRQGEDLVGTPDFSGGPLGVNIDVRLTPEEDAGHLRYADSTGLSFTLARSSDSTAGPSAAE